MSARNRPQVSAWVTAAGSTAPSAPGRGAAAARAPAERAEQAAGGGHEPTPKNSPAHSRL